MKHFPLIRILGLVIAAAVLPACHRNSTNRVGGQPPPGTGGVFKAAMLSGRQEAPPVLSAGSGNATVTIDGSRTLITVTVNVSGLTNITEAHLHVGLPKVDGPIIFPLSMTTFASPLTVTLTSADLIPAAPQGVSTFGEALTAIENGSTYVNVHTATFPDGEIRGQVGPANLSASLTGGQEVPPVGTLATGTMTLVLNGEQTAMTIVLNETGITNVTAAHIHVGPPGLDGPIILPLAENFYQVPLVKTLTSADFTPQPSMGITTFDLAVDAILSGNTYVNVHTSANPDGEIRGQILP